MILNNRLKGGSFIMASIYVPKPFQHQKDPRTHQGQCSWRWRNKDYSYFLCGLIPLASSRPLPKIVKGEKLAKGHVELERSGREWNSPFTVYLHHSFHQMNWQTTWQAVNQRQSKIWRARTWLRPLFWWSSSGLQDVQYISQRLNRHGGSFSPVLKLSGMSADMNLYSFCQELFAEWGQNIFNSANE